MLRIAIAIPTFNRLDKLKVAIESIKNQQISSDFELYCVISNIASDDGTSDYLDSLEDYGNLKFIVWNQKEENIYLNWRRCAEAIPDFIDWVWFHGDDDYIVDSLAVKKIVDFLRLQANDGVSFVHISQSRRSSGTGRIIEGSLFDLCNEIGFHEVLGWMSSLFVKRDRFVKAILASTEINLSIKNPEDWLRLKISAFAHSSALLQECLNERAIYLDVGFVEPQDLSQTDESIAVWQTTFTGERYFYLVDDILKLYEDGVVVRKLKTSFYRYINYSIWDRYLSYLISDADKNGLITESAFSHWQRVQRMAETLESDVDKKMLLALQRSIFKLVNQYLVVKTNLTVLQDFLGQEYEKLNAGSYPFKVLSNDGDVIH